MTAGVDSRDQWMRRAGPFYSLLVAGKQQTRLPLARDLEPSDEDLARSRAWLPIAGLVLGGALAIAAALLLETGLVPLVVATLVIAIGVFVTGGWLEIGVARAVERLFRDSDLPREQAPSLAISFALVLLVVVKAASLFGTAQGAWIGALIASHAIGRWTLLCALELPRLVGRGIADRVRERARDRSEPSLVALGVTSGIAIVIALAAGGGAAAVSLLVALPIAWLGGHLASRAGRGGLDAVAAAGAAAELVSLICFAAWSPAG